MAFMKMFLILAVAVLAQGNQASLQDRYGTPAHGDNHAHGGHHAHAHHTEHGSHGSGSTDSLSGASSSGAAEFVSNSASSSFSGFDIEQGGLSNNIGKSSNFGDIVNNVNVASGNSGSSSSGSGADIGSDGSIVTGNSESVLFSSAAGTLGSHNLEPSNHGSGILVNHETFAEDITITKELTVDVFTTLLNTIYNTVPVTLTEFMKTTVLAPTLQVLSTPVDDHVYVATAPVTRTDTITVTDTSTAFQCATEVSTDFYTVTHRVYNIQQQLITSTVVQTQVFRPTVVSTRIDTEYDTETVLQTVTNTVVVNAGTPRVSGPNFLPSGSTYQQGTGFQHGANSLNNGVPQSGFIPFNQGHQNHHVAANHQQFQNHGHGSYY